MSLFSLKVLFFLTFVANYYFTEVERSLCMYTLFRFVAFAKRKRRRERMKVKKPKGVFDKFKHYLVCYFSSRQLIKRKKKHITINEIGTWDIFIDVAGNFRVTKRLCLYLKIRIYTAALFSNMRINRKIYRRDREFILVLPT